MVPTLGFPKQSLIENGFINAYSIDAGREEQCENCIYILFKPKNIDKFRIFLENQYNLTDFIVEDYDYDGGYVVIVCELSKKYAKDFAIIRTGKYSKTSKEFQNLFQRLLSVRTVGSSTEQQLSLQYRIFNKTEDLVKYWEDKFDVEFDEEQEVWKGWEEESETLYIEKIKKQMK